MSIIGRTWEDETPEVLDRRVSRLNKHIRDLEQDKRAYFIANDGETVGKTVISPDKRISLSMVEYKDKFYTLTCSDSMKSDRRVAYCDVLEGKSYYETLRKKFEREK